MTQLSEVKMSRASSNEGMSIVRCKAKDHQNKPGGLGLPHPP